MDNFSGVVQILLLVTVTVVTSRGLPAKISDGKAIDGDTLQKLQKQLLELKNYLERQENDYQEASGDSQQSLSLESNARPSNVDLKPRGKADENVDIKVYSFDEVLCKLGLRCGCGGTRCGDETHEHFHSDDNKNNKISSLNKEQESKDREDYLDDFDSLLAKLLKQQLGNSDGKHFDHISTQKHDHIHLDNSRDDDFKSNDGIILAHKNQDRNEDDALIKTLLNSFQLALPAKNKGDKSKLAQSHGKTNQGYHDSGSLETINLYLNDNMSWKPSIQVLKATSKDSQSGRVGDKERDSLSSAKLSDVMCNLLGQCGKDASTDHDRDGDEDDSNRNSNIEGTRDEDAIEVEKILESLLQSDKDDSKNNKNSNSQIVAINSKAISPKNQKKDANEDSLLCKLVGRCGHHRSDNRDDDDRVDDDDNDDGDYTRNDKSDGRDDDKNQNENEALEELLDDLESAFLIQAIHDQDDCIGDACDNHQPGASQLRCKYQYMYKKCPYKRTREDDDSFYNDVDKRQKADFNFANLNGGKVTRLNNDLDIIVVDVADIANPLPKEKDDRNILNYIYLGDRQKRDKNSNAGSKKDDQMTKQTDDLQSFMLRLQRKLIPLTKRQKLKKLTLLQKTASRRSNAPDAEQYGIPFEMELQGLGQVNP